jgi:hypothetical protein
MMAIIGVPINSKTAYVLDKFLKNQEDIQKNSVIPVFTVFATEEVEFAEKLRNMLAKHNLKAEVESRLFNFHGCRYDIRS